jgi:hypothetical protein
VIPSQESGKRETWHRTLPEGSRSSRPLPASWARQSSPGRGVPDRLLVAAHNTELVLPRTLSDPVHRFVLRAAKPRSAAPNSVPRLALGWVSSQVERLLENDHLPRSPSILSSPSTGSKR